MKRIVLITCLLLFLLATILTGCKNPHRQLHEALNEYCQMIDGQMPEDLCLTIYYVDPSTLSFYAWSKDNLIAASNVTKIVVESDELATQWEYIQGMDMSVLQQDTQKTYVNARICYVFETSEGIILEVVLNGIQDSDPAFINGIAVENHPVLYEVLLPFLTEDDCNILGI